MPTSSPRRGLVVSHTHWDRAWYLPFEAFRHRLVRMVDRLIALLDAAPRYRAFMLDGQTVLLEDYLEIRPERRADLERLIRAGRLQIGPWYVLPDLFLVSGEAIVRNLQRGRRLCMGFGGYVPVGYVPDPFGHPAQLPQILQGFGIDTFLFMRGLSAEDKAEHGAVFHWQAPDGSAVLAVYQRDGYFNAGTLGQPAVYGRFDGHAPDADRAHEQIRETTDRLTALQPERTLLFSNGFDHMPEQPGLPDLLDALNARLDDLRLEHGTVADFFDALKAEDRPHGTVTGDLLGNADHPILLSVYSTRLYLKRQNHRAQSLLERYAEPIAAADTLHRRGPDARPFLAYAWRELLRNHPHDDICGCSVDAVHDENETRFGRVVQTGESLVTEHLETLLQDGFAPPARTGAHATTVWVWNPHPWPLRAHAEATVYLPNPDGEDGPSRPEQALAGCDGAGRPVAVTVRSTAPDTMRSAFLESTWARRYDVGFTVDLPPLGYTLVHLFEDGDPAPPADSGPAVLENDHYLLQTEDDGLALTVKALGRRFADAVRFAYDADAGDTYSFGPVPDAPTRWARLASAQQATDDPHALDARFALDVPAALGADATVRLDLDVRLRLTPDGSVVLRVRYDNTARDGRLRIVLPTGIATRTLLADGHFRLAERTRPDVRTPETAPERYAAYPGELDYATCHQGDGVIVEGDAHRAWVASRGLPEVELLPGHEGAGEAHVAVTLHRAVGHLSVVGGRIRRCGAGPHVPTPGAQCLRPMGGELAFGLAAVGRPTALRRIKAFAHPPFARELPYLPHLPDEGPPPRTASLLALDNPGVLLSAFKPEDDGPGAVLRVYNVTDEPQDVTATLGLPASRWCPADLTEAWDEDAAQSVEDGRLRLTVAPHAIRTVLLRADEAAGAV